jgi:hypothetical protein
MTEKPVGDLVIVQGKTSLLLSSTPDAGVDASSRDHNRTTHLNSRAGLHHT